MVAEITFKVGVIISSVVKITFVVAEITLKVDVITSSVAKITFVVAERTLKVDLMTYAVTMITFVVAETTFKVTVITSLVAKIAFKNQTKSDETFEIKKWRPLTWSWVKGSLKAFPEGGYDLMTSSIYSLDLLSKCTLCAIPPWSPLC